MYFFFPLYCTLNSIAADLPQLQHKHTISVMLVDTQYLMQCKVRLCPRFISFLQLDTVKPGEMAGTPINLEKEIQSEWRAGASDPYPAVAGNRGLEGFATMSGSRASLMWTCRGANRHSDTCWASVLTVAACSIAFVAPVDGDNWVWARRSSVLLGLYFVFSASKCVSCTVTH